MQAVRGSLFLFAVDLADRGARIDHQRRLAGARAQSPGARQSARQHRFELADVTERERPPQRPDRRGRHRAEPQHPTGAPGAQHPDMIDVSAAREHRGDHRADLGARVRGTRAHPPLDQRRNTQTGHQRARQDQARVGHQALMINRRCEPVRTARRSRHKKCLLFLRRMWIWTSQSSQIRRPFSRTRQPPHTHHTDGFRLRSREFAAHLNARGVTCSRSGIVCTKRSAPDDR